MSSDHEMSEAPASAPAGAFQNIHVDEDGNPIPDEVLVAFNSAQNVRILPGSSETAASFEFTGEDHTLGNALRWIVMKKCVSFLPFPTFRPPLSPLPPPHHYGFCANRSGCSPEVEFCGFSIPHPSEPKMNIRIQTYEREDGKKGMTAFEALEKGFDDLADLCDVVSERFGVERGVFGQQQ